jgi:DNA modification methylase
VKTWVNSESFTCIPPVSVFDTKLGYWQKRKKQWKAIGLDSGEGRDDNLLNDGMKRLAENAGMGLTGTSIFDPVLCEIIYNWYSSEGGIIFDPFAGGSVRGIVAEMLDRHYIGIDLSQRQVDANQKNADLLGVCPAWHCDDSRNMDEYIPDGSADLVFSCPPYHDLEKYSDHPLDLSNMSYEDFVTAYADIIAKACRKLKEDRFAVFVVGDIRDKKGAYRDFIGLTKSLFRDNGLFLYNESILLEQYGTAPMRAGLMFRRARKTAKVHQNVLVFYKGDLKKIKENIINDFRRADLPEL